MHEAAALRADLRLAGIEPAGWVINQSLHAAGVSDPVLAARAAAETRYLAEIASRHAARAAILPMLAAPPDGASGMLSLLADGTAIPRWG